MTLLPTCRISVSVMHPSTSVLLAKISRQAPASRCRTYQLPVLLNQGVHCPYDLPLPAVARGALLYSLQCAAGLWSRPPISARPSFQSSFANMTAGFFVRRHPLTRSAAAYFGASVKNQHILSLYLGSKALARVLVGQLPQPLPLLTRRSLSS